MTSLVERFKLLRPEVDVLHDKIVRDGDGIYCLQITATDGRIFYIYTDDGGSLSIEEVKIMSEQVESLLEGACVLQVLMDKCGDEIYHLEIITTDGDTVHIYASGEGSLYMGEVKNSA